MPYLAPLKTETIITPADTLKRLQADYDTVFLRFCEIMDTHKAPGPGTQPSIVARIIARKKSGVPAPPDEGGVVAWVVKEAELVTLDTEMDLLEEEIRVVMAEIEGMKGGGARGAKQ